MRLSYPTKKQIEQFAVLSDLDRDSSFSLTQLQQSNDRRTLYNIEFDQISVGFIIESVVLDEAELIQILITKVHQQKGLATQALLLWHQCLINRQVNRVFLEVRHNNEPAIKLYETLGYQVIGRRKNYYHQADGTYDALNMEKRL